MTQVLGLLHLPYEKQKEVLDKGDPVEGGVPGINALLRESKVDGF